MTAGIPTPVPSFRPLILSLSKGEHADSIILSLSKGETRATKSSKAATRGNWNEVWDNFDRRMEAKTANDLPAAEGDEDMFAGADVAAEQLIITRTSGIERMWNCSCLVYSPPPPALQVEW